MAPDRLELHGVGTLMFVPGRYAVLKESTVAAVLSFSVSGIQKYSVCGNRKIGKICIILKNKDFLRICSCTVYFSNIQFRIEAVLERILI